MDSTIKSMKQCCKSEEKLMGTHLEYSTNFQVTANNSSYTTANNSSYSC